MQSSLVTRREAAALSGTSEITVKKAVDWLYSKQVDGTWEKKPARDAALKGQDVAGGQWGAFGYIAAEAEIARMR